MTNIVEHICQEVIDSLSSHRIIMILGHSDDLPKDLFNQLKESLVQQYKHRINHYLDLKNHDIYLYNQDNLNWSSLLSNAEKSTEKIMLIENLRKYSSEVLVGEELNKYNLIRTTYPESTSKSKLLEFHLESVESQLRKRVKDSNNRLVLIKDTLILNNSLVYYRFLLKEKVIDKILYLQDDKINFIS